MLFAEKSASWDLQFLHSPLVNSTVDNYHPIPNPFKVQATFNITPTASMETTMNSTRSILIVLIYALSSCAAPVSQVSSSPTTSPPLAFVGTPTQIQTQTNSLPAPSSEAAVQTLTWTATPTLVPNVSPSPVSLNVERSDPLSAEDCHSDSPNQPPCLVSDLHQRTHTFPNGFPNPWVVLSGLSTRARGHCVILPVQ